MKLSLLWLLAVGAVPAAAAANPHPCPAHNIKVTKLKECSTGSAFCRRYLAPATRSFTHTITVIRTRTVPRTFTTTDVRDLMTTATSTSTWFITLTNSETDTRDSCATTIGQPERQRLHGVDNGLGLDLEERGKKDTGCGIIRHADPSRISGACNCLLAKTETVRSEKVITSGKTTRTVRSVSTVTVWRAQFSLRRRRVPAV